MAAQFPAHATPRRITRTEYHRMGEAGLFQRERVELIDGLIIKMTPAGPHHCSPLDELARFFFTRLGVRARVRVQQPYVVDDGSEPEPDLAVVPEARYATEHPREAHLIVEVANSSLAYDRETKTPLYARSNVREYWIVDVEGQAIEVHRNSVGGIFQSTQRHEQGTVSPEAFPELELTIASLFEG